MKTFDKFTGVLHVLSIVCQDLLLRNVWVSKLHLKYRVFSCGFDNFLQVVANWGRGKFKETNLSLSSSAERK